MARHELLVTVDKIVSGNLQPVAGASVLVKLRSTGSPVTVYFNETGGTTVSNPLVTDANGRANGWVDEGSLLLTISGSGITSYNQPYEAVKADELVTINGARVSAATLSGAALVNDSIPNTKLAQGAVLGKHLAESAMPLGTILPWWQPSKPGGGFAIPSGFALCNGQGLASNAHDFPGGGTVTLPNLTNKVLIGADATLAYAATGASVGMNGAAGSNTANFDHSHTIAHTHTIPTHSHIVANHTHGMQHQHNLWVPDHTHGIPETLTAAGGGGIAVTLSQPNTYGFGGVGILTDPTRATTDGAAPSTSSQSGGTSTNASSAANSGNAGSATQDMRQASHGVLFIMKVRNTI
jgi:hypothetical protein